jgi:glycosyltransferase involved in cell wall biosynthesis
VCAPPVDVDFFHPGAAPRGDFLLAVGALVPYKRYDLAIEAAGRLGRRLVLVGSGPESARLRAAAWGSAAVEVVSGLDPSALRDLYRTCGAFLQPGEEDFGIAAVEALACGAPVVAWNRGGARDIVRDGRNGVLYEEATAEGLADAVARAERAGFDYTEIRASALSFRPERFAGELTKALKELLP